jgi:hypothetical protein
MRLLTSPFGNSHSVMVLDCWAYALIPRVEAVSFSETSIIWLYGRTFQKMVDLNSLFWPQDQFPIGIHSDLSPYQHWSDLEIVWGSGNIASHIVDIATGWKYLFSFTPRPLHLQGESSHRPLGLEGGWTPESYWVLWRRWIVLPLPGVETTSIWSFSS